MLAKKRFLLGGGGALMPVLVSILAVDVGAQIMAGEGYTLAEIVGMAIRYGILFIIGGVVAYLHVDEEKPFKLFELGIAAPALITSLVTANGIAHGGIQNADIQSQSTTFEISLFSNAYADDNELNGDQEKGKKSSVNSFQGFIDGLTGKVYQRKTTKKLPQPGPETSKNTSEVEDGQTSTTIQN